MAARTCQRIRPDCASAGPTSRSWCAWASIRIRISSSARDTIDGAGRGARREDRRGAGAGGLHTRTAGRILAIRSFGKANFLVLSDGRARIQVYIRQDSLSGARLRDLQAARFRRLRRCRRPPVPHEDQRADDLGLALEFLAKCFVPLPEKWHGLSDVEMRYRQRYLDLIVNPDSRQVFEVRSRVLAAIRRSSTRAAISRSRRR